MSENNNFFIQNQNNNHGQNNSSNQYHNQPFNNAQEPLINNENIHIYLNPNEISLPNQSQTNIEDKANEQYKSSLSAPFTNDKNILNINNNIQQNIEINQNINGNLTNNNNYNSSNINPQMNYQPNLLQNNAGEAQVRNNRRCCSVCSIYDYLAAFIGVGIGLTIFFRVTKEWWR